MPICYRFTLRHLFTALVLAVVTTATFTENAAAQIALNCTLHVQVPNGGGSGSSCWGYTDPNTGVEYAIFGHSTATRIYNISNPAAPVLTGSIPGPNSSWREMKTYRQYCYVGTEGGGGLQIIDLTNPEAPFLAATSTVAGLSSIHTVTIDSLAAKLYANGSNIDCAILSLANPVAPTYLGAYSAAYVHDSYARNDTLWAACFNAGQVRVLNTSNAANITQIVAFSSERTSTHNCWPTEDRTHLLVTDETTGGRVTSWDITDLQSPIQVDGYTASSAADAHNVHVRDNLAFVAHYTMGLQVLDITDPTDLVRVAYYDTYAPAGGLFNGAWGVFNYFPSGTVVVSDIEGGMFLFDVLEQNFAILEGTITDATSSLAINNARVTLTPGAVFDSTNASGFYRIPGSAGTYTAVATAFGYAPDSAVVNLLAGQTVTTDFALTLIPTGSVGGVFQYAFGAGIPNARVSVRNTPYVDVTDAGGLFSFATIPAGQQTVALDFWTSIPDSQVVNFVTGVNPDLYFPFQPVSFAFEFEDTSAAGWGVNAQGGDNASTGIWTRVNPRGTGGGLVQPEDDHSPNPLVKCWITGQGPVGGGVGDADVDGGRTTLTSGNMDLSLVADPTIQYFRWYINDGGGSPGEDVWKVQISSNGGTTWVTTDSTRTSTPAWKEIRLRVADYVTPSTQVRMRFIAEDAGSGSVVEAGVDDFRVWGASVTPVAGGTSSSRFALLPNSPNPFNPHTAISFDLARDGQAQLSIFSLEGRRVRTLVKSALPAGRHSVAWDGRDERGNSVASGVYLMRLESGKETAARKIVLAK
ncbi:MAG: choice-of-anchor B family protein [bacterium]